MHHVYFIASFISLGAGVVLFDRVLALPWACILVAMLLFVAGLFVLGEKETRERT